MYLVHYCNYMPGILITELGLLLPRYNCYNCLNVIDQQWQLQLVRPNLMSLHFHNYESFKYCHCSIRDCTYNTSISFP